MEFTILHPTLLLCKIARAVSSLLILIFKPYGTPVRRKKNPRRVRRFNTFSRKVLTVKGVARVGHDADREA